MNLPKLGLVLFLLFGLTLSCNKNIKSLVNEDGTYNFETVEGDPMDVKVLTLANGLKVYMSVNKDAPRIQTMIATRAGSKNDPADATGLAHYLEHMLFKGTSKIASLDWDKEKVLLKQISNLYEKHRAAAPEERVVIYKQIDSLSGLAAQYVAANEYDKMISGLGAEGTNAYTSLDRTVYLNDIPSNEAEKWLQVESERFSELVLRLFHTELESVYEEYNIAQNKDSKKVYAAFLKGLLPNHPYGTQTTLGTGEHLKTPSMKKIHEYFSKYYVPNNMAIILSGDFDPNEMARLVEKYWGKLKAQKLNPWKVPTAAPLSSAEVVNIYGKEKSNMQMGWRLPGAGSDKALKAELVARILYNRKAGLIDMNLIQQQSIGPRSSAGAWAANDYSFFFLYGEPREGQSPEAVKDLMFKELERLKMGEFEDWMLEAVINNMELEEIQALESNAGRANTMLDAFIFDISWAKTCEKFSRLRKFTKKDIVDFASDNFKVDNCVVVYKREGEDNTINAFDKPNITPVELNREGVSEFAKAFQAIESPRQKPLFLDYKQSISNQKLSNGIALDYIKNTTNKTFQLAYIVEMGSSSDNVLPVALRYLEFLGTDKYSAKELQQEFFKLGLSFKVISRAEVSYVSLTGLDRSFEKGVALFEHILANAEADEDALTKMVSTFKKARVDAKKDKRQILQRAMVNYGYYGSFSPFTSRIGMRTLDVLTTKDMMKRIKKLTSYEHKIFYYGSKSMDEVAAVLNKHHQTAKEPLPLIPPHNYIQLENEKNKVLFVDMKGLRQAEILMISKGTPSYDADEAAISRLYNEYFGVGLSSIVFQEIRESRALAYSTYVHCSTPDEQEKAHYLTAFIGTQADKMKDAIPAMLNIIEEMPISNEQINAAAESILKKIESERITGASVYWNRRDNEKLGTDKDIREAVFQKYQTFVTNKDEAVKALKNYHEKKIKGRKFTVMVLGDKENLDMEFLKTVGEFQELTLEQIFAY